MIKVVQQKRLIFCVLAMLLCSLTSLESTSLGQEIVIKEATFPQLKTLIGEVVAGRKSLSKGDRASFVKRIASGDFNREKWFDINSCNVVALSMLNGPTDPTEARGYFSELRTFFKSRPDMDGEYKMAVHDILLMFRVLTLGDDIKGRLAEKKCFQSINNADQKEKIKMLELLAMANWSTDSSSLRFTSLKTVFVQEESTEAVRMAVIQCLASAATLRGSISDKDLAKFFLQLYGTGVCSKEHTLAMFKAMADGN